MTDTNKLRRENDDTSTLFADVFCDEDTHLAHNVLCQWKVYLRQCQRMPSWLKDTPSYYLALRTMVYLEATCDETIVYRKMNADNYASIGVTLHYCLGYLRRHILATSMLSVLTLLACCRVSRLNTLRYASITGIVVSQAVSIAMNVCLQAS